MGDFEAGIWDCVLTMRYNIMIRECSTCEAPYLLVIAMWMNEAGCWRRRKVFKKSCGCGHWLNNRRDRETFCPEGSLFVFEEEAA